MTLDGYTDAEVEVLTGLGFCYDFTHNVWEKEDKNGYFNRVVKDSFDNSLLYSTSTWNDSDERYTDTERFASIVELKTWLT